MRQNIRGREVKIHNGGGETTGMKSSADTTVDMANIEVHPIQDPQGHLLLLGQVGMENTDNR